MTTYFVVPCGGAKLPVAAPAASLYTGTAFRLVLSAAIAEAAATTAELGTDTRVLVLSALHGLVDLDEVLAPYDVRMGGSGAITVAELAGQMVDRGIAYGDEVCAMLPRVYREALEAAAALADDITVTDVYEAAPGIGYQRGVASSLLRGVVALAA